MSGPLSRLRHAGGVVRQHGVREMVRRGLRVAASRFDLAELELPHLSDIADSSSLLLPVDPSPLPAGKPLTVAWVTTPPGLGSGGHTTMFRMVEAVEAAGHNCTLMLYDRFGYRPREHEAVIRQGWPRVKAAVRDISEGFDGTDVAVATSWQTAHVLAARSRTPMRYCYLVQDFEPYFYPHGVAYALAEDTYRFGFHLITIGRMLPDLLAGYGAQHIDVVEFGCDTEVYRRTNDGDRRGVLFYTKPDVPRRGFVLGKLALELFHRRHPEQPIHLFGTVPSDLPFPAVRHGNVPPAALNDLYNAGVAGLALSFTNVSLAPVEMLAAGMIPVANDSPLARAVLGNPHVAWVNPSPIAVAEALSDLVTSRDVRERSARAAASVTTRSWDEGQGSFVAAIERIAYGG